MRFGTPIILASLAVSAAAAPAQPSKENAPVGFRDGFSNGFNNAVNGGTPTNGGNSPLSSLVAGYTKDKINDYKNKLGKPNQARQVGELSVAVPDEEDLLEPDEVSVLRGIGGGRGRGRGRGRSRGKTTPTNPDPAANQPAPKDGSTGRVVEEVGNQLPNLVPSPTPVATPAAKVKKSVLESRRGRKRPTKQPTKQPVKQPVKQPTPPVKQEPAPKTGGGLRDGAGSLVGGIGGGIGGGVGGGLVDATLGNGQNGQAPAPAEPVAPADPAANTTDPAATPAPIPRSLTPTTLIEERDVAESESELETQFVEDTVTGETENEATGIEKRQGLTAVIPQPVANPRIGHAPEFNGHKHLRPTPVSNKEKASPVSNNDRVATPDVLGSPVILD